MRPCSPNCSITLRPTITYEKDFYSSPTLERSIFGIIHTLAGDLSLVDTTRGAALHCLISFMDQFLDRSTGGRNERTCEKLPILS